MPIKDRMRGVDEYLLLHFELCVGDDDDAP